MQLKYEYEAESTLNAIQRLVEQNVVSPNKADLLADTEQGWGQYLSLGNEESHVGTYGTTAGIRILCLDQPKQQSSRQIIVRNSLKWLERQWRDPESKTNNRKDISNVYRVCFFARMLGSSKDTITEIYDTNLINDVGSHLWSLRVNDGWPQYNYKNMDTDRNEPDLLATAFALFSLANYDKIATKNEYAEILLKNAKRVLKSQNSIGNKLLLLVSSMTIHALTDLYEKVSRERDISGRPSQQTRKSTRSERTLLNTIKSRTKELVGLIRKKLRKNLNSNYYRDEFYVRLYSLPRPSMKYTYLPFLIGPIVMLSLVSTKRISRSIVNENIDLIETMVEYYTTRTGDGGQYISDIRGPASIGDHLWIAEFLQKYTELSNERLNRARKEWGVLKYWMRPNYGITAVLTIAVGTLSILALIYPNRVSLITTLIGAVVGALLTEVATRATSLN